MRYLWDFYQDYLESAGLPTRLLFRYFAGRLRLWDYASAARVEHFIANSKNVAERIHKHYRREAVVVYPPVDHRRFCPADGTFVTPGTDAPYVLLGQLVSYKRADLAIRAFNATGRKLVIVGDGGQRGYLQSIAGSNIEFCLRQSDAEVVRLLAGARALVFPGEEDFGIVPLEAMSAGRPVVAYSRGGSLETVTDCITGLFFDEPTPDSLNAAIDRLEARYGDFEPKVISDWAASFDVSVFEQRLARHIGELLGKTTVQFRNL
jgi:glycosyltransferase involved in cell wall biosynthesis